MRAENCSVFADDIRQEIPKYIVDNIKDVIRKIIQFSGSTSAATNSYCTLDIQISLYLV